MVELLTVQELADYLRVTVKTVYRLLEKGVVPAARIGHLWRFDKDEIDSWLRQSTKTTKARILVIDDDPSIGELFQTSLQEAGHTVTIAINSVEGLELVKTRHFDIVFLDLMLPGMDGTATFKQIREVRPELPVTIVTGYPDSELMMSAMETGPFGIIKKPFTALDIMSAVNNYLRFGMTPR